MQVRPFEAHHAVDEVLKVSIFGTPFNRRLLVLVAPQPGRIGGRVFTASRDVSLGAVEDVANGIMAPRRRSQLSLTGGPLGLVSTQCWCADLRFVVSNPVPDLESDQPSLAVG